MMPEILEVDKPMMMLVSVRQVEELEVKAVAEERERCAKIADKTADCAGDRESMLTAQVIAEEIRKGE